MAATTNTVYRRIALFFLCFNLKFCQSLLTEGMYEKVSPNTTCSSTGVFHVTSVAGCGALCLGTDAGDCVGFSLQIKHQPAARKCLLLSDLDTCAASNQYHTYRTSSLLTKTTSGDNSTESTAAVTTPTTPTTSGDNSTESTASATTPTTAASTTISSSTTTDSTATSTSTSNASATATTTSSVINCTTADGLYNGILAVVLTTEGKSIDHVVESATSINTSNSTVTMISSGTCPDSGALIGVNCSQNFKCASNLVTSTDCKSSQATGISITCLKNYIITGFVIDAQSLKITGAVCCRSL